MEIRGEKSITLKIPVFKPSIEVEDGEDETFEEFNSISFVNSDNQPEKSLSSELTPLITNLDFDSATLTLANQNKIFITEETFETMSSLVNECHLICPKVIDFPPILQEKNRFLTFLFISLIRYMECARYSESNFIEVLNKLSHYQKPLTIEKTTGILQSIQGFFNSTFSYSKEEIIMTPLIHYIRIMEHFRYKMENPQVLDEKYQQLADLVFYRSLQKWETKTNIPSSQDRYAIMLARIEWMKNYLKKGVKV